MEEHLYSTLHQKDGNHNNNTVQHSFFKILYKLVTTINTKHIQYIESQQQKKYKQEQMAHASILILDALDNNIITHETIELLDKLNYEDFFELDQIIAINKLKADFLLQHPTTSDEPIDTMTHPPEESSISSISFRDTHPSVLSQLSDESILNLFLSDTGLKTNTTTTPTLPPPSSPHPIQLPKKPQPSKFNPAPLSATQNNHVQLLEDDDHTTFDDYDERGNPISPIIFFPFSPSERNEETVQSFFQPYSPPTSLQEGTIIISLDDDDMSVVKNQGNTNGYDDNDDGGWSDDDEADLLTTYIDYNQDIQLARKVRKQHKSQTQVYEDDDGTFYDSAFFDDVEAEGVDNYTLAMFQPTSAKTTREDNIFRK